MSHRFVPSRPSGAGRPDSPALSPARWGLALWSLFWMTAPGAGAQEGAPARDLLQVGVHGAYAEQVLGGTPGVGARASLGLGRLVPGLRLLASAETFFPGCGDAECEYREANLNLVLGGPAGEQGGPWLGGGLNYQTLVDTGNRPSPLDDAYLGGNLVLGFALQRRGPVHPFGEVRWELLGDGVQQVVLSVGVLY